MNASSAPWSSTPTLTALSNIRFGILERALSTAPGPFAVQMGSMNEPRDSPNEPHASAPGGFPSAFIKGLTYRTLLLKQSFPVHTPTSGAREGYAPKGSTLPGSERIASHRAAKRTWGSSTFSSARRMRMGGSGYRRRLSAMTCRTYSPPKPQGLGLGLGLGLGS